MSRDDEMTMTFANISISLTAGEYKGNAEYYARGYFKVPGRPESIYGIQEKGETANMAVSNLLFAFSRTLAIGHANVVTPHNGSNVKNERVDITFEVIKDEPR